MQPLTARVRSVWHRSPADLVTACKRRVQRLVGNGDHGWDYTLDAVLMNRKAMNTKLEIERWERQWRICRLHRLGAVEAAFDFEGTTVLELGCGPVLGCGPMAIFRGARTFRYREPDLQRSVLESAGLKSRYFRPLYDELAANYGRRIEFDAWYEQVIDLSVPLGRGMPCTADITTSHSVLEHIPRRQFQEFLTDVRSASRKGGVFFHTVDFGPHGHGNGTLQALYAMDWNAEPRRLNLYRRSDVVTAFAQAGLAVDAVLVYKADAIDERSIHSSWRNYPADDLASRVVYFVGHAVGREAAIPTAVVTS